MLDMRRNDGAPDHHVLRDRPPLSRAVRGPLRHVVQRRRVREQRLHMLVDHIREKLGSLTEQFGKIGNERLMLMAAILVTDELFEVREGKDTGVD